MQCVLGKLMHNVGMRCEWKAESTFPFGL